MEDKELEMMFQFLLGKIIDPHERKRSPRTRVSIPLR